MAALYERVKEQFATVYEQAAEAVADGKVTFAEIWDTLVLVYKAGVLIMEQFPESAAAKREAVIAACMECWHEYLKPADLPYLPDFVVDPAIEAALPKMLGWGIDSLVSLYNGEGWPALPSDPPPQ